MIADKACAERGCACHDDRDGPGVEMVRKEWVGLTHEETHKAIGTAGVDLLELAKMWSDNKVHVYQFDNEARKIIETVLRRASSKLREKNHG